MNKYTTMLCATLLLASGLVIAEERADKSTTQLQQKPDASTPSTDVQQQRLKQTNMDSEYKDPDAEATPVQKLRQKPDSAKKQPKTNTKMEKGKSHNVDPDKGGVEVNQ